MSEQQINDELNQWFSTYGVITAERILGTYQISLPASELLVAVKSPFSFYHQLLQVPLKNVLNGIVLQQASDYHVYAQKLFIDYFLAGESGKGPEAQGAITRESMESERKQLVILGEEFHQKQLAHEALIANSQSALIKIIQEWKSVMESAVREISTTLKNYNLDIKKSSVRNAVNHALIHCNFTTTQSLDPHHIFIEKMMEFNEFKLTEDMKKHISQDLEALIDITVSFKDKISVFLERSNEMSEQALSSRTQFYETILRVTELIKLLPEYRIDPVQDSLNRESLYFDRSIGEKHH